MQSRKDGTQAREYPPQLFRRHRQIENRCIRHRAGPAKILHQAKLVPKLNPQARSSCKVLGLARHSEIINTADVSENHRAERVALFAGDLGCRGVQSRQPSGGWSSLAVRWPASCGERTAALPGRCPGIPDSEGIPRLGQTCRRGVPGIICFGWIRGEVPPRMKRRRQ
jgi:hypothetical protein